MKTHISCSDLYPYFTLDDSADATWLKPGVPYHWVDIPDDKMEWIVKTMAEFKKVQRYLGDNYHEQFND